MKLRAPGYDEGTVQSASENLFRGLQWRILRAIMRIGFYARMLLQCELAAVLAALSSVPAALSCGIAFASAPQSFR